MIKDDFMKHREYLGKRINTEIKEKKHDTRKNRSK